MLLAPFCYLFITSSYIFFRIILFKQKQILAILATGLFSIFSGPFLIYSNILDYSISEFIIRMEFHFINKTYGYISFFLSLSLMILILNNFFINETKSFNLSGMKIKYLVVSAFFLVLSFTVYIIPLLMGLLLIFIYCLLYKKNPKSKNLKIFLQWFLLILSFLAIMDILMVFFLSDRAISKLFIMFIPNSISDLLKNIPSPLIFYSFFSLFLLFSYIMYQIFKNYEKNGKKTYIKINSKYIYKYFLLIFTIFVCIYFIDYIFSSNNLINVKLKNFNIIYSNIFFLNLYLAFTKIGLIGIIYIYLSYLYYKSKINQNHFFKILFLWILFPFFFASIPINLQYFIDYNANYQLFFNNFIYSYWYNRIWFYSLPSLCIFGAFGISKFFNKLKHNKILKTFRINDLALKLTTFSLITIVTYSGLISTGMSYASPYGNYSDNTIKMVGWISENLPYGSNLLIYNNWEVKDTIRTMTYCNCTFFEDIFNENSDPIQMEETFEIFKKKKIFNLR